MAVSPPNTDFPVGTKVSFVDPYGRNPVEARVRRHFGETDVTVEDERGVIYFGATWRIVAVLGAPEKPKPSVDLNDLF